MEFSGQTDEAVRVRSDTGKTALYIFLCLPLAMFFSQVPERGGPFAAFMCDLIVVFSLVLMLLFVFRLFRPMRLILTPEGLDYSTGLRRFRYGWQDVADVSSGKFDDGRVNHYSTVISLKPGHGGIPQKGNALNIQGRGWEVSPEDLTDFVKEARDRWGQRAPAI